MNFSKMVWLVCGIASSLVIAGEPAVLTNLATAPWEKDKDGESVMLHADQKTGGIELLVRFPAGHVIKPHSHESNERIIVLEGQLTLRQDSGDKALNAGGFAFLPAGEAQRMSCSSKTRCTFYLAWDGKPDSHPVK